jgi:hypothetical protein
VPRDDRPLVGTEIALDTFDVMKGAKRLTLALHDLGGRYVPFRLGGGALAVNLV